jgi:hypothetical protein
MSMFTPAGAGARRPRRGSGAGRRVLVVAVALLVIASGSWAAWQAGAGGSEDVRAKPAPSCPAPSPAPTVVPAAEVTVNVYNASDQRGLAARVGGELTKRGFVVKKIDNDPLKRTVTGAAEVRHSEAGAAAASTVAAQVGDVVSVPDQRKKATVDLALGAGFTTLLTPEQAAAILSPTPEPLPSGCATAAAAAASVGARMAALDAAVTAWAEARTLAGAHAAAEEARNLVTGPDVAGYGDSDGDGQVAGANERGLLPGETGEPGLVTRPATSCVRKDVLGGGWGDPAARWDEVRRHIARWTPTDNTFPDLASHPQRVVGWATLALDGKRVQEAREYAGHARIHVDVTASALAGC